MPLYSFYYSIPYLILLSILFLFYLNETRKIKICSVNRGYIISFVFVVLFIGLRGHLYTDFISYYPFYEDLPNLFNIDSSTFFDYLFEPGFIIYSSVFKTLSLNYFVWVFINTFIDLLVLYLFFKKYSSHSVILCLIVCLVFQGFFIEFNLYRNSKAMMLFIISLPYLLKRRFIPYLLLNLIGVLFHSSAALYILLYPVLNRKINKTFVWSAFFIVNVLFLFNIHFTNSIISYISILGQMDIMSMKMASYQDAGDAYAISFGYIERMFSFIVFTLSYSKLVKMNEMNRILYNCFLIYYLSFLLFADIAIFTERIPLLFIFSYWILYSNSIYVQKGRERFVICASLLIFILIKTVSMNSVFCKYDNLLWGIESYDERYDTIQKMYFD